MFNPMQKFHCAGGPARAKARAVVHKAHIAAHCSYLGSVWWFAHGPYAIAAGVLLVVVLTGALFGETVTD